jgi:hypothetical protein
MWFCGSVATVGYLISYWRAAEEAIGRLENDPAMQPVLEAVERTLARLADDPFSPRLGTTVFVTPDFGGVSATPAGSDDWYVFWQRGQEPRSIEIVLVHQLRL